MHWLHAIFIIFAVIGLLLFVYGVKKKSIMSLFFGASFIIGLIFLAINWNAFLPLVSAIALVIAFLIDKKLKRAS